MKDSQEKTGENHAKFDLFQHAGGQKQHQTAVNSVFTLRYNDIVKHWYQKDIYLPLSQR